MEAVGHCLKEQSQSQSQSIITINSFYLKLIFIVILFMFKCIFIDSTMSPKKYSLMIYIN